MLARSGASAQARVLRGFDDPSLEPERWDELLRQGDSDCVFLTRHWQSAWWEAFGRGRLLLVAASREGRDVALAPFFCDAGMVFFVGSGGSDYLDFVGRADSDALLALLDGARRLAPGFVGFRFYHVPRDSRTAARLEEVSRRLELDFHREGGLGAPFLALAAERGAGRVAADKRSLRRHERSLQRDGELVVEHLRESARIGPHLDAFFAQHRARWHGTDAPSLFHDPRQTDFYRRLVERGGRAGWLRFTRVVWNGTPVAFHLGFSYRGSYLWYKPSFAIELARRSPGEVLLRRLLLAAAREGAHTFDFGLGEEAFKARFATGVRRVDTLGLYPRASRRPESGAPRP